MFKILIWPLDNLITYDFKTVLMVENEHNDLLRLQVSISFGHLMMSEQRLWFGSTQTSEPCDCTSNSTIYYLLDTFVQEIIIGMEIPIITRNKAILNNVYYGFKIYDVWKEWTNFITVHTNGNPCYLCPHKCVHDHSYLINMR